MHLEPNAVRDLINGATCQKDYIEGLYRMVHPDFDAITAFGQNPKCSSQTWQRICTLAQMKDRELNELRRQKDWRANETLPGGAWLNYGFSVDDSLGLSEWEVQPVPPEALTYAKAA